MRKESLRVGKQIVIPANSAANISIPVQFDHPSNVDAVSVFAMGVVEIANVNDKHYNICLQVNDGTNTIWPTSKKLLVSTENSDVNNRFTPIEFSKPNNLKSAIVVTPTEASGAADIVLQVVFKYTKETV